jgi:GDPmannose 4,6-dehydratase
MQKKAIITGITGQDGAYLARLLLKKKIKVYGVVRRTSNNPFQRLNYFKIYNKINYIYSDIAEFHQIGKIIKELKPHYIFNLASQSFVTYSFDNPIYTDSINNTAVINILEAIRLYSPKTRFYQASSSEMYGGTVDKLTKLNEYSKFNPISPYAIAKLSGYYYTKLYRESYNLHASNGILFNHESPLRGDQFVTKKIVKSLVEILYGIKKNPLLLGNIHSRRDWGHAEDYVEMMLKIIQKKKPDDYVVSSQKNYSIKQFINFT